MDCTLRDGGYINNWNFGCNVIHNMLEKFDEASIDFVELGFLTSQQHTREQSLFSSYDEIKSILPSQKKTSKYVVMVNCGEFDITKFKPCKDGNIFGIRIAFHKHQMEEALELGKQVQELGYKLFLQPMCTDLYTDTEMIDLIHATNRLNAYAFYIVDSFGIMTAEVVEHLSLLIDEHLDKNIMLGFHAHNNLQLAFSNTLELINMEQKRDIIVDATVSGIGRGAGNLNMELIVRELNLRGNTKYELATIVEIYDTFMRKLQTEYRWGYSIPLFLTANLKCHPNYAKFLENKGITSVKSLTEILEKIEEPHKMIFSKNYIRTLYNDYMKCGQCEEERRDASGE